MSEGLGARKREVREALRGRRAALAAEDVHGWSARLGRHVRASATWREAGGVAAFVGVRGEPDTRSLLDGALAEGKALWLPRVVGNDRLSFHRITDLSDLVAGRFGLREPPASCVPMVDALDGSTGIDLVLVPGLGFASDGARIGFGRGYYNRALVSARDQARPVRIGLCFASFLDPSEGPIPVGANDVRVHAVATEYGVQGTRGWLSARRG